MALRGFEKVSTYQETAILPERQTRQAAGYDFHALEQVVLEPQRVTLIPTGIKAYMPENEFLGLYLRSSIATKKQVMMINSVGIVDADYYNNQDNEGHIYFACYNLNQEAVTISQGERIGQGIFQPFLRAEEQSEPELRTGGFGSTTLVE
ncbi:MAG: dUTP diphosphatase [Culicoidibacterales bacterium]